MKYLKFLATLLVTLMLFGTAAQAQDDEIREALKELNKECPIELAEGMTLSNFSYDGENLVFNIKYDDDAEGETIKALNEYPDLMKQSMLEAMVDDAKMAELVDGLKDAGIGLSIVIKGSKSRQKVEFTFTARELEKAMKNPKKARENDNVGGSYEELDAMLLIASASCPIEVGEGISISAIDREGSVIYMEMTLSDSDTYEGMCLLGEVTIQQAVTDDSFADMLVLCKEYKVGFGMRYRNAKTNETCKFSIPYSELK